MGYSARYHAISLIAVFGALAIGILIGAEFGGDVVSDTRRNLEHSLTGNLQDAREQADELSAELGQANEFSRSIYPVLVRDQLDDREIGVLGLGNLDGEVSSAVESALGPTGARLVAVGVVREPVDVQSLAGDLAGTRFAGLARDPDALTAFGTGLGRQLALGGGLLERVRGTLYSRASGNFGGLDGIIVAREQPDGMGPRQRETAARFESGLLSGITATRVPVVGVELAEDESTSIPFFQGSEAASVDNVDRVAGQVALVFALLGAEGSFGVKGTADRLLPDLLAPEPRPALDVRGDRRRRDGGG